MLTSSNVWMLCAFLLLLLNVFKCVCIVCVSHSSFEDVNMIVHYMRFYYYSEFVKECVFCLRLFFFFCCCLKCLCLVCVSYSSFVVKMFVYYLPFFFFFWYRLCVCVLFAFLILILMLFISVYIVWVSSSSFDVVKIVV